MKESITWPELVEVARSGLASREPFDVHTGDLMARGIVAMDAEMHAIVAGSAVPLSPSDRPPRLVDREALHREPLRSIIEHAIGMARAIVLHTGKAGLTRICLTPEVGLMIGLTPSTSMDISTPGGPVELYVEATPRSYGTFEV